MCTTSNRRSAADGLNRFPLRNHGLDERAFRRGHTSPSKTRPNPTTLLRAAHTQALVVSNSIGRDGLVGAEAARRRSRAVGFLLQVCFVCAAGMGLVSTPLLLKALHAQGATLLVHVNLSRQQHIFTAVLVCMWDESCMKMFFVTIADTRRRASLGPPTQDLRPCMSLSRIR